QQVKNYKSLLKDLYQHCMIPLTLLVEDTSSSFHRSEDLTLLLVETSIAMTTCVCKWLSPQLCASLVEGFGLSDTTPTSIVILYLDQVLSNSSLRDKLFCTDELQCRACHSLLVSLIRNPQYSSPSLSIESLTNSVSLLPFIQRLTGHDEVSEPLLLILQLLKGINSNYESSLDLVKWRNYLLIIIGNIISLTEPSLANGVSLSNVYQITASVVRHCSKLIYSKTDSKCLLPLLLNKLMISSSSGQLPGIPALIQKYLCH
uniref:Uncharacterized protein n=1 Tax=Amphimedon queenslandica TaxID=400682 RepID=A0A1X7TGA8_AMPQE